MWMAIRIKVCEQAIRPYAQCFATDLLHTCGNCLDNLSVFSVGKASQFSENEATWTLAVAVWALARHSMRSRELMSTVARPLTKMLPRLTDWSVRILAWSFLEVKELRSSMVGRGSSTRLLGYRPTKELDVVAKVLDGPARLICGFRGGAGAADRIQRANACWTGCGSRSPAAAWSSPP